MNSWFGKLPKKIRATILIAALVAIGVLWYLALTTGPKAPPPSDKNTAQTTAATRK